MEPRFPSIFPLHSTATKTRPTGTQRGDNDNNGLVVAAMGDNHCDNPTSPMFGMIPGTDTSIHPVTAASSSTTSSKHYWRRDRCRTSRCAQSSQSGLPRQVAVACVNLFSMLNLLTCHELLCGDEALLADAVKDDSGWCSKNNYNSVASVVDNDSDDDSSALSMNVSPSRSYRAS